MSLYIWECRFLQNVCKAYFREQFLKSFSVFYNIEHESFLKNKIKNIDYLVKCPCNTIGLFQELKDIVFLLEGWFY